MKRVLLGIIAVVFIFATVIPPTHAQTKGDSFLIHKDGAMVYDQGTKSVWMRCSLGSTWDGKTCAGEAKIFSFDEAKKAAASLNSSGGLNGAKDWVVPTVRQLQALRYCTTGFKNESTSLADGGSNVQGRCQPKSESPTLPRDVFPKTPSTVFWSSSDINSSGGAWVVHFGTGNVFDYGDRGPNQKLKVRLIRSNSSLNDPVALGFSQEKTDSKEFGVLMATNDWAYVNLKGDMQKIVNWAQSNGNAYVVHKSGVDSSFPYQKNCSFDFSNVRKLMLSGASQIWARHGAASIDELHSISEETFFWLGDCSTGKANGEGVVVFYYQGKINSSTSEGAVRSVVTVNNGVPYGKIYAYSNTRTCFNSCQNNSYAKEIGRLANGVIEADLAREDLEKSAGQSNAVMGQLVGGALMKAAEVIKEGAALSAANGTVFVNVELVCGLRKLCTSARNRV